MIQVTIEEYVHLLGECITAATNSDPEKDKWHPEDIGASASVCVDVISTMTNWLNQRELNASRRHSDLSDLQAGEMLR